MKLLALLLILITLTACTERTTFDNPMPKYDFRDRICLCSTGAEYTTDGLTTVSYRAIEFCYDTSTSIELYLEDNYFREQIYPYINESNCQISKREGETE